MSNVNRSKLGLFVVIALMLITIAVYFIGKKQHLFGDSFRVVGNFIDVSGLQVGNNVRFAGVNIGSVESVTIVGKNAVRVEMLISEDVHHFIKTDSEAGVGSESMMGNKVIVIGPGSDEAKQVSDRGTIGTSIPLNFDDILKQVKRTGENAELITANLARLTSTVGAGKGAIGKLFTDETFSRDLSSTMENLKRGSTGLKDLVDSAQHSWLLWGFGGKKEKESDAKIDESSERPKSNNFDKSMN